MFRKPSNVNLSQRAIALAFILGLALLKSGSVWLAAFLHALNNQTSSFFTMMVYKPNDPVFSFGIGIYGLVVFAIIVTLLLWRRPAYGGVAGG